MAAAPAPITIVVPETPPCSQAAAQTPLTLQALPNRCSQPDGSPVRLPVLGDASCIGDTLRIDDVAEDGGSSEGEDIMLSGKLRNDYKSIPHLDSYSTLAVDDSASLPALSEQQVSSSSFQSQLHLHLLLPPLPPPPQSIFVLLTLTVDSSGALLKLKWHGETASRSSGCALPAATCLAPSGPQ
jgi:hypothetical protein